MKRLLLTCTDLMALQFLVPHVKYLSQNDFTVELACSDVGGRLDELRDELHGIAKVHTVRLVRSPFSPGNLNGYKDLKKLINSQHWDIIWTNEPVMGVMTRLAARKARRSGTNVIYMAHGFHFYKGAPKFNWLIYYPVEKFCSRFCDMIITINNEDYQRAKNFHAKRVEKINGIGVDLEKFAPNDDIRAAKRSELGLDENDIMLFNVGELTRRKNQHVIIEALHQLKDPHIKLFICGRGETEAALKAMVNDFGLGDSIHFLGYRRDINELCCAADIFVFTSLQEGLPRALMEAMANGKAVVCSDIRGNTDLIDNEKGGFVVPNEPSSISSAIKTLADNKSLVGLMGRYNIVSIRKYREDSSLQATLDLIKSL